MKTLKTISLFIILLICNSVAYITASQIDSKKETTQDILFPVVFIDGKQQGYSRALLKKSSVIQNLLELNIEDNTPIDLSHFNFILSDTFNLLMDYLTITDHEEKKDFINSCSNKTIINFLKITDALEISNEQDHSTLLTIEALERSSVFKAMFNENDTFETYSNQQTHKEEKRLKTFHIFVQKEIVEKALTKIALYQYIKNNLQETPQTHLMRFIKKKKLEEKIKPLPQISDKPDLTFQDYCDAQVVFKDDKGILDLSNKHLCSLQGLEKLACIKTIRKLNMNNNRLIRLDKNILNTCRQLRELNLSNNQLTTIEPNTFENFSQLKHLNLSNNAITELSPLSFFGLKKLYGLYLCNNNLQELQAGTFSALTAMEYLAFGYNPIETLEGNAFTGLNNLKQIIISQNLFDHNEERQENAENSIKETLPEINFLWLS